MRSNSAPREVRSQGTEAVGTFGLSDGSAVHIMTILRDTLYTDRVLAVLREYTSNAWDAHREAGKSDLPIKVTLPTLMSPTLVIRDYGWGLSDNDVLLVYTQYGESSKRDTDDLVGALGIGCKSAFAYTDQFTVTSWHGGMKRVYVAVLDETNVGEMRRLDEASCDEGETGIEIRVPVKQTDISLFEERAKYLFTAFRPLPDINLTLLDPVAVIGGKGYFDLDRDQGYRHAGSGRWTAVMGCIPYRVDLDQLGDRLSHGMRSVGGTLYFDIGEVEISASREDLKYTDKTLEAIYQRAIELQDAYLENMAAGLENKTSWQQRLEIYTLGQVLRFPIPEAFQHLWAQHGTIRASSGETPKTFRWGTEEISLSQSTKLVIHDDTRSLKGFSIPYGAVVIKPLRNAEVMVVERELAEHLKKMHLTGIPIMHTSQLSWLAPYRSERSRSDSIKHRVKTFCLIPDRTRSQPRSSRWEVTDRTPTDDDVYVKIFRFEVSGGEFYDMYYEDRKLAKFMEIEDKMPPIYGYKPDAMGKAKGIEYFEWRKTFFAQHVSDKVKAAIRSQGILTTFDAEHLSAMSLERVLVIVQKGLGKRHLLTKTYNRIAEALKAKRMLPNIPCLAELCRVKAVGAKQAHTRLNAYYPLLAYHGVVSHMASLAAYRHRQNQIVLWIDYIKLADRDRRQQRRKA